MYVNDPSSYYKSEHETLGWEVTVSMMLEEGSSPCRNLLAESATFGYFLARFLRERGVANGGHFFELGGGYGTLARDLKRVFPDTGLRMMDISPVMLNHQRSILGEENVKFLEGGAGNLSPEMLENVSLFLCNEVISDLVTVCNKDGEETSDEAIRANITRFSRLLDIDSEEKGFFLNLGALMLVETVCEAGVPRIWISEQSAERDPVLINGAMESPIIDPTCRPVILHGHVEYPVRFSDLEHLAGRFGYKTERGIYSDLIPLRRDPLSSLFAGNTTDPEQEMKRQFVEDCYKYEYLFLVKD